MEKEEVLLPGPDWQEYEKSLVFEVELLAPNNERDENPRNNLITSIVVPPEVLPANFILYIEPNNLGRERENEYMLTDYSGGVVYAREDFSSDTLFRDVIELLPGCYEFRLTDKVEDGMNRHWWNYYDNPEQMGKNGKLEIQDMEGNTIRKFPYDFGQEILYRFSVKSE